MRCLVALLLLVGCGSASEAPVSKPTAPATPATTASEVPQFTWPVPKGWRSETIPFPLEFAPDIPHRGVEELRFAPDFFKPEAPGYWTYAFAWVVTGESAVDVQTLEEDLTIYFRGLTAAVAKSKEDLPPLELDLIRVQLEPNGSGSVVTFDAFGDGRQIDLDVTVKVLPCGSGKAVLVSAVRTGQPSLNPSADDVVSSFSCSR